MTSPGIARLQEFKVDNYFDNIPTNQATPVSAVPVAVEPPPLAVFAVLVPAENVIDERLTNIQREVAQIQQMLVCFFEENVVSRENLRSVGETVEYIAARLKK